MPLLSVGVAGNIPTFWVDLDLSASPDTGLQMIFATIILTGLLYYFFAPGLIMLRTPSYLPYAILTIYAQTTSIPAEVRLGDPWES